MEAKRMPGAQGIFCWLLMLVSYQCSSFSSSGNTGGVALIMSDEKYDKARMQHQDVKKYVVAVLLTVVITTFLVLEFASLPEASRRADLLSPKMPYSQLVLAKKVQELDAKVREIKKTGVIMETDVQGVEATTQLQEATRRLLKERYGPNEPYRVKLNLEFQRRAPDYAENGPHGSILLEMASSELMPHAVFSFLEMARQWQGGAFNRIAPHLVQASVNGDFDSLAFQEYSVDFPHYRGTVGFSGRPSGPDFYVSIVDNTSHHGPGSQQKKNPYEADSCFATVIDGYYDEVQRIESIPAPNEYLENKRDQVHIKAMHILVPRDDSGSFDGYVEWTPESVQ